MLKEQFFGLQGLSDYEEISTLGPDGTSSQAAAVFLSTLLDRDLNINLFNSFELAGNYTESNHQSVLLVANAYRDIDLFYMTPNLKLAGSFFFTPPDYYICCRDKTLLKQKIELKKRILLSSHRAPSSRIPNLLDSISINGWNIDLSKIEISFEESTAKAALSVTNNESDLCLINESAAKLYELDIISLPMVIEMVWSVFCQNIVKQ